MAEINVKKIIKDLGATNWSSDNAAQMKAVQLLKGLALSDEKLSNKFMIAVDKATTSIAKNLVGEQEKEKVKDKENDKDDKENDKDDKDDKDIGDEEKAKKLANESFVSRANRMLT